MNLQDHTQSVRKSRRDRFLTVAERRTKEIMHKIQLLGNCSNKSAYQYHGDEVERIFEAIQEELDAAKARFQPVKKEIDFSLR